MGTSPEVPKGDTNPAYGGSCLGSQLVLAVEVCGRRIRSREADRLRSLLFLTSLALTGIFPTLSAAAPVSQTPQLHFNGRSASLKEALVTAGDIEGIPGGPLNVTVSKVNDATGLYQDPDSRLPCGAKAPK